MIAFTVPGPPVGKGRPKFSRQGAFVKTYTPEKTASYENLVRLEYERQCGCFRFGDTEPLKMSVIAYFPIPESTSKKKKAQMIAGEIFPLKKCDCDNILKIIADAGNGVIYRDDKQIVQMEITKLYGEIPRVEVIVQEANK